LWARFDNGDNLLFREADLKAPDKSALFRELRELADPQARMLVGELQKAVARRLEDVPKIDELLPEPNKATATVPANPPMAVKPGEPPTTSRSPWDFDEASPPEPTIEEKVQRRGMPRLALVVGGGVAAAMIAIVLVGVGFLSVVRLMTFLNDDKK